MQPLVPAELVESYGQLVSSLCRNMLRDEQLSREVSQEVWLEILQSLKGFRGNSRISTWIFSIAVRIIRRHAAKERKYTIRFLRGYFRGDDLPIPEHAQDNLEPWVKEMCDKCLIGTLQCLDSEDRLSYLFRDVAELSYGEIAEILQINEQSVRQMVSRSRRRLNNFLHDQCSLHNTEGQCRCRMKKWVKKIDLSSEYDRIRNTTYKVRLYKESEDILPRTNYWAQLNNT